jgi:plastocyanin
MTRKLTTALVLLTTLAVAACDDGQTDLSPEDAVPGTEVEVVDNRFEPAVLAIEPGDTVTWTRRGQAPHDVVADDFESEVQTNGTFTQTFQSPGQYTYVCTIHAGMEGLIVVEG